ncbi:undecaprenyl-diphosphate phosphatase [Bombella pollinis]|uniref:Undecaprenyl-diphosphatase n=1 Tax=Bombella pollinis TaxID=2967337 RepID=A0ABT3WJM7_9PROT|nr:undecaprenyl-diphosphate phosphatase [Bombella pollinis]MCX5619310.1 undecaprenyl-diphosphate phosphatase [Bombella pollinis]
MTLFQAVILSLLQGITEPFPVSSLGHAVLLPALLHWPLDEHSPLFLPFLTMLHVGTLVALAHVFWADWWMILSGLFTPRQTPQKRSQAIHLCRLLVVATLPAVFIGGIFEHYLRHIFANPLMVAGFLTLNGLLLITTEAMRRRALRQTHFSKNDSPKLDSLTLKDALSIGFWQCLALLPGLSRSGATINGGLMRGLDHLTATRFSLLMAQPIILAATAKEAWQLRHAHLSTPIIEQSLLGAFIAGITAFICSRLLLRFFKEESQHTLTGFGLYCLIAGIGSGLWLYIAP